MESQQDWAAYLLNCVLLQVHESMAGLKQQVSTHNQLLLPPLEVRSAHLYAALWHLAGATGSLVALAAVLWVSYLDSKLSLVTLMSLD